MKHKIGDLVIANDGTIGIILCLDNPVTQIYWAQLGWVDFNHSEYLLDEFEQNVKYSIKLGRVFNRMVDKGIAGLTQG